MDRFILPQPPQRLLTPQELGRYSQDQDYLNHGDILRFLRKHASAIAICAGLGAGVAMLYVFNTPSTFTARAQILIDPTPAQALRDNTAGAEPSLDAAKVEGQLAVLRSETIAQSVIAKLDLLSSPDFRMAPPSILQKITKSVRNVLGAAGSPTDAQEADYVRSRIAIATFQNNLDVRRVGLSYAIDIAYTARDAAAAARIANAVADVYVRDQIATMSENARQSSVWLEKRIDELRIQLNDAAREVQLFRGGQNIAPADQRNPIAPQTPATGAQQSWVTLAELESKAQNYRKVYETYLQAFTETVQKQSLAVASARVITPATRPLVRSQPKSKLIVMLGVVLGSLGGLGFAFLRHSMDNTVQSAKQLRDQLGLNCLAMAPRLGKARTGRFLKANDALSTDCKMRQVSAAPFSPFSGALKTVRTAIVNANGKAPVRCIGVTSCLPGEGKTTISSNLALAFALSKSRVLLIDADIHHSTISQIFAPKAATGLIEVLNDETRLHKAVVSGQGRGPDILPVVKALTPAPSYELLTSDKMSALLASLKQTYDYIIVDMPPIRPIVDGLAISSLLDGVILVAEWSQTPLDLLEEVAGGLHTAQAEVLGVILTKVDPSMVNMPRKKQLAYGYEQSIR